MKVRFYKHIEDRLLKFAVIVATSGGKWVFCRHKDRNTLECPGGHRERREHILDTAKRELKEETGAIDFHIEPVCAYSVTGRNRVNQSGEETFGMLYTADIKELEGELHNEIERIVITEKYPENWTYPLIQPQLMEEAIKRKLVKVKKEALVPHYELDMPDRIKGEV